MNRTITLSALCAFVGLAASANASVVFTSTGAGGRAASVEFSTSGNNLVVRLTNTSLIDITAPAQVLTGVYFNISGGSISLSRVSALLAAGSSVVGDTQPAGGVVGGEWAYRGGISIAGASYGISSVGLGVFGGGDLFPGPDLDSPTSPNGVNYGITTNNDNFSNNNGGASVPLIRNSVVFTLSGLPTGFDLGRISGVVVQYGSALDEPQDTTTLVPTPGALALLSMGGLVASRRRRVQG
ncbi:MAG: PEP-CTERM sorting domain-containing protein [Phycisphaerales bacterium]|nr:PEP-CTERM sorting domain-containing protein [Phycisphaerales bacterium]